MPDSLFSLRNKSVQALLSDAHLSHGGVMDEHGDVAAHKSEQRFGPGNRTRKIFVLSSISSIAMRIGCAGLSLAASILVARYLGSQGYGVYSWALAVINLTSVPAQFGLPPLVVRETAKASQLGKWSLMKGIWMWASGMVTLSSSSTAFVVLAFGWLLVDQSHYRTLVYATIFMALIAVGSIRSAALRGMRYTVLGQLPEHIIRPTTTVLLLLAIPYLLHPFEWTPAAAMALQAFAAFTAFIFGNVMFFRCRPQALQATSPACYAVKDWIRSAVRIAVMTGLGVANQNIGVLMLSLLATDSQAGQYAAVSGLAAIISFGLQAVALSAGPHLARLFAQSDHAQLQQAVRNSSRAAFFFAAPVALVLIVYGNWIVAHLYGTDFDDGGISLAILALGHLFNAAAGTVGLLLIMTGHEIDAVKSLFLATVVNFTLASSLISPCGVVGAAVAASTSLIIWNASMWWFVRSRLQIETCGILR
jgi:O-antigen/teichoic acid export membrane protein